MRESLKSEKSGEKTCDTAIEDEHLFQTFGYGELCDHIRIFRDADDETVVTMNHYGIGCIETDRAEDGKLISGTQKVRILE